GVEAPAGGVRGVITEVANPGHAGAGDLGGLAEQGNLLGSDFQVAGGHMTKGVAVEQCGEAGEALLELKRTFVARGGEGGDVERLIGEGDELEVPVAQVEK